MVISKHWAAYLLLCATSIAFAQSDPCERTYINSTKDVQDDQFESYQAQGLFNQHCESSGSVKSSSLGIDLSATVKKIPLSLGITTSNNSQKLEQFCKIFQQSSLAQNSSSSYKNTVVTSALALFNQCEYILNTSKVAISHTTQGLDSLVIQVEYDPGQANVSLRSVVYDPKAADCYTTGISSDGSPTLLDRKLKETLMKKSFAITCTRKFSTSTGGVKLYPPLNLALVLNKGTYNVSLVNDSLYPFSMANSNKATYDTLQSKYNSVANDRDALLANLASAKSEIQDYRNRISSLKVDIYNVTQAQGGTVGCQSDGGDIDAYIKAFCKDRRATQRVAALSVSGGRCGTTIWTFGCVNI